MSLRSLTAREWYRPSIRRSGATMTLLPAMAANATVFYWLSGLIGRHFSELTAQVLDQFLFVGVMVLVQTVPKNMQED